MQKAPSKFMRDLAELKQRLCSLKQQRCPSCERIGTLNRHSRCYGNDPCAAQGQVHRGQRAYCSKRGQRGGCGKTFSMLLPWVLPRHTYAATRLWNVLERLGTGAPSIKSVWESLRPPLTLVTLYHVLQRLRGRLAAVRSALCRLTSPPPCDLAAPLLQTVQHLRHAFLSSECPVCAFQVNFQQSLMG